MTTSGGGAGVKAWDRQRTEDGELEPALWFGRFDQYYRPAGPERSLLGAYNNYLAYNGKKRQTCPSGSWSRAFAEWNWKARAEAWDAEQRIARLVAEEQERAEMLQRHIRLGRGLQSVATAKLQAFVNEQGADLSPGDVRAFIKEGIGIERQARGLPEYLIAVAKMTDDELRKRYAELIAEIGIAGDSKDDESPEDSIATNPDEAGD